MKIPTALIASILLLLLHAYYAVVGQHSESTAALGEGGPEPGTDDDGTSMKRTQYSGTLLLKSSEIILTEDASFLSPVIDRGVSYSLKTYGEYELPKITAALDLLVDSDSPVYLDIGAHIGVWTVALARHRGGKAQVHAFEAVRETYYYLGANVVLNELHNVVTHYGAVADRPGVVDVAGYDVSDTTTVTNIAGFSIPHSRRIKELSNGTALMRSTPVLTLDGLFESGQIASCPTFMKLDIETFELLALRGATRILLECQPALMMEFACHELNKSIISFLDKLGYSMAWLVAPTVGKPEAQKELSIEELYGDITVVAVPKYRQDVWKQDFIRDIVMPIDPTVTTFNEYDILVCRDGACTKLVQSNGTTTWLCRSIPQDQRDFYESLINPTTGLHYS